MRLVTVQSRRSAGSSSVGILAEDGAAVHVLDGAASGGSINEVIARGPDALDRIRRARADAPRVESDDVALLAPIPLPKRNVICVGRNYAEHASEFQRSGFDATSDTSDIPEAPVIFTKAPSSVIAPGTPIETGNDPTGSVDYEGELAAVIGLGGKAIPAENALDHVFGYTIINDVTARNLQHRHRQWFLAKSIDGFCPMGPSLVTADEVGDLADLELTTTVNGEVRQKASVADLIFDLPTLIATISSLVSLEPGDVIATGTPKGVGIGFDPPRYLKPGDEVAVEVSGIGRLVSPVH